MKSKIISFITVLTIFTVSCNDDFLQRNALNQMSEDLFWQTESDAEIGVNAIYNVLKELDYNLQQYQLLDDFSDISWYQWSHALTGDTYDNRGGLFYDTWKRLYKGVQRANTAIAKLDEIKINATTKNRLKGEALFLRGLFYFKLWDYFGGVPLYNVPIQYSEATKPRNTSEEVAAFIVKDLTDAIALFEGQPAPVRGRATKWAALSLRGKTYLYAGKWAEAAADFNEVITNSGHDLHPVYEQAFNFKWEAENRENIFAVQYIMVDGYGNQFDIYSGNRSAKSQGWQVNVPTPKLIDEYENMDGTPFSWADFPSFNPANNEDWKNKEKVVEIFKNRDPRLQATVLVPWAIFVGPGNKDLVYKWPYDGNDPNCFASSSTGNAWYCWKKFVHQGDENTQRYHSPNDVPVIRFADVLLMYAEAKNEANNGPDASVYAAINRVRTRVGLPNIPEGTKNEVFKRIQHERKVEFAGEGIWYSDMRRYKLGIDLCNHEINRFNGQRQATRKFTDRLYLWPIPQVEREINPSLTQNPGWN